MRPHIKLPPNEYLENISKMFNTLYNEEQLTDVTLWCKEGSIKAHKVVLATCSPYFHKIFLESDPTIITNLMVVMHGVRYQPLHDLIELIYKGTVEVAQENLKFFYELAQEFEIVGIPQPTITTTPTIEAEKENRISGQKRASTDHDEDEKPAKRCNAPSTPSSAEVEVKKSETASGENVANDGNCESPKLSAWAKKQRKFKCLLCPSSFKRSSHLTRHQLVHTGERPFACDQCDKAFSRHDKLKHHIRKTHENIPELETIVEQDYEIRLSNLPPKSPSPLPFVIAQVESAVDVGSGSSDGSGSGSGGGGGGGGGIPAKRGRGRPRKYPIGLTMQNASKALVKRGRGRPRINPSASHENGNHNGENYDITNLPFGDLEYLTMPIIPDRVTETDESMIIEPLVEIKTEKDGNATSSGETSTNKIAIEGSKDEEEGEEEEEEKEIEEENNENDTVCDSIINKITKIGECTISVANH